MRFILALCIVAMSLTACDKSMSKAEFWAAHPIPPEVNPAKPRPIENNHDWEIAPTTRQILRADKLKCDLIVMESKGVIVGPGIGPRPEGYYETLKEYRELVQPNAPKPFFDPASPPSRPEQKDDPDNSPPPSRYNGRWWDCGNCGKPLDDRPMTKFCRICGTKIVRE